MYRCANEKISKTENKVMKKKKNGLGSGFGRKIERDGGIQRKKAGKRDLRTPIVDPLKCLQF